MFNVKLFSLSILVFYVPSTSATEDCYDRICEFEGKSVSCYKKNGDNVCDQLDGNPICNKTISKDFL